MKQVEFTPRLLSNLKPATNGPHYEVADTLVSGLRVRVGSVAVPDGQHKGRAANISFILLARFPPAKNPTRRVLGQFHRNESGMTLQAARAMASNWKAAIRAGVDPTVPIAEDGSQEGDDGTLEAVPTTSVKDALDLYETNKLALLQRGGSVRRALDGREGILKELKDHPVRSLTRADLAQRVRDRAKVAAISANRQLSYLKTFLSWCVDEELMESNVAETIKKPSAENERDRYHSLSELAEIWHASGTLEYPFGPLMRLLITLPMRREEIAAMKVAELFLGDDKRPHDAEWVLPADRTKKKNALRVPISALSRSIIKAAIADPDRPADSPFVFTTTSKTSVSGFSKARKRLDEAIDEARKKVARDKGSEAEEMPHWVLHDLRTTFNTHACERLGIDAAVADRILNHIATATRSKIMRIYNRSELYEPRKHALAAWANLLESEVINPKGKRGRKRSVKGLWRDCDHESEASALFRRKQVKLAMIGVKQRPGYGEAKARSAVFPLAGEEQVEDALPVPRRNAGAVVGKVDPCQAILQGDHDVQPRCARLPRIFRYRRQHGFQCRCIHDHRGEDLGQMQVDDEILRRQRIRHRYQQRRGVRARIAFAHQHVGARQFHQPPDKPGQPLGVGRHIGEEPLPVGRRHVRPMILQQLDRAGNAGQRRLEFMADRRGEVAQIAGTLFQALRHLLEIPIERPDFDHLQRGVTRRDPAA